MAVIGLALAWLLYRLERAATRRRDIVAARAVLLSFKRGMVEGADGQKGWGEEYFRARWTEEKALESGSERADGVRNKRWYQVFVVPTEPLRALIASPHAGDLISEDVVYAANLALWHIVVFNQLVEQSTQMNALHLAEIVDPNLDQERREAIAIAIGM